MSSSPSEKKPKKTIHDFFKPYLKSNVPAKRPSPSNEADRAERLRIDDSKTRTPNADKRRFHDEQTRTPGTSARPPFSAPVSRASLSIRRKTSARTHIEPPSTYKRASIFSSPRQRDTTPKSPQAKPFSFADLPSSTHAVVKDGE